MKLSEKQIEMISKTAASTALEFLERERQRQEKEKQDRRLRNVKLLLRNYRSFANHSADVKLEIDELNKKLELDELETDEFAIESIKRSKKRTLAMVKFINKMIEVYRIMCEQSGDPESLRRYQVVYDLYIGEPRKTAKEIARGQNVHQRTIYKDVNKACETLVVLMFGVDGVKLR
ncbi:hypothetical protein B5V89_14895 [Heyndrickxia sporothermodurans]|uniref:hypothetical protein n=1 Tax=Heyndrickxia sporothermodurans TaxID=46224 RepID=UPI000D3AAD86|nr:hypothetical protein [Heyndrickxia sporothermodurans]PTY77365.1 hypothetical protein B5V89_14895 [Heyndrickxia sporothermodurans]